MSCEFKPGDEVVCVDVVPLPGKAVTGLVEGRIYTVSHIGPSEHPGYSQEITVFLVETRNDAGGLVPFDAGYLPQRFRKVQKRDLTAWLGQITTFEEPKRVGSPA